MEALPALSLVTGLCKTIMGPSEVEREGQKREENRRKGGREGRGGHKGVEAT